MTVEKTGRLEALYALRRKERADALERLEQVRDEADSVLFILSEKRSLIESLMEKLTVVEPEAKWSGAALTALLDNRRRKSAELLGLKESERDLSEKSTFLELEIKKAEDEVASAQKALSQLKEQMN